ncbi:Crp/Fnr family transcriptional regulator [cf. Phormidesmis sp. LEGE 11477]|uniref:Crp/Fnr family transcriptional regulator n=1 Tax=cf. Phormidesmis sp. LEGE 11477 TaxID=1828680 RepID=UPI0018824F32|nr:Crp/Fnr family transcriptional regulator [cf. Phormidesmis sp. LEGE 11477]MBE9060826.1 Crp/Fnr family transcriptional regulator [cf. Phormidesmis sp. LEGE 11477]
MLKTAPRLPHGQKISSIHSHFGSIDNSAQLLSPRLVRFKRQEQLNFVNHSLWKIHRGYIRTLTCDSQGEPVPTGFWTVGDIIGYPISQTYPYIAQCLTTVEAEYLDVGYRLSRETLLLQVRQSHTLLRIAHCKQAEQRLLQLICWLAERFGHAVKNSRQISLKLTHQEIAESIGITRVTVTRLLKTLERKRHIVWNSQERLVSQATFEQCYVSLSSHYR